MQVSAFTFLRNGTILGYPYIESIRSALPLVDEFVVAVGDSDDDTLQRVRTIGDPKVRVIETRWNERMTEAGFVYAQQKMIAQFNCGGDWALYLEGDEVLHERDLQSIHASMQRHLPDSRVEALVFDYHHFFGTPQWVAVTPGWYRRAPRIIRNTIRNYSPDGLFFVVMDRNKHGRYPRAALANATMYHYGHVRQVARMRTKLQQVSRYWKKQPPAFADYSIDPRALRPFTGDHPALMAQWLASEAESGFRPDPAYRPDARDNRYQYLMRLERLFGADFSRKHFKLVAGRR